MNKQQEALKLALEALEVLGWQPTEEAIDYRDNAIDAIREALAEQPAQQEEIEELTAQRDFLAEILTRTANALKGQPAELSAHSWHDLPEVAQRLKAVQQQEPVAFLANGTRFKISYDSRQNGGQIHGIPPELGGQWVAFVAADDDCHLKLTSPQPAQQQESLSQIDVACDIKTLCANGDLPDIFEEVAEWVAAGAMPAQPSKPLTDEEIVKITSDPCLYIRGGDYRIDIARAIEAAHGIKE